MMISRQEVAAVGPGMRGVPFFFLVFFFLLLWDCCGVGGALAEPGPVPPPARAALSRAQALIGESDYGGALAVLNDFRSRCGAPGLQADADPRGCRHAEVLFAMGTCHLLMGDCDQAVPLLSAALEKDADHMGARLNMAKAAYETGDFRLAGRCFEDAYRLDREKKPVHLFYAAAAYQAGDMIPGALAVFERLFAAHPADIQTAWREQYVRALLSAGRPREALDHMRLLADSCAGEKKMQWQEALLHQYLQLDMVPRARQYAMDLARLAPENPAWWKALAHIHLQAQAYPQALTALTILGFLTPPGEQEKKLMADLQMQLGIPGKAAALYEELLTDAGDRALLEQLAGALQRAGRPEAALRALERFPEEELSPALVMRKADLLYTLKRYGDAARSYLGAAETDGVHRGRAYLMAGYAALQTKDVTTCRRALERAAAYEKQRAPALMAMRQLPAVQ